MKKEDCCQLGYISKIHGYKGEVIILLQKEISVKLNKMESVFIEINGQLIPFFIDAINQTNNSAAILKLHDIESEVKAKQLIKCPVFIPLSTLPAQKNKKLRPSELIDFKVIDDVNGNIGKVFSILEMPQQLILEIHNGVKEILIPANEEIIYKIDKKNKTIFINAPEGLIDIYLNNKT